MLTVPHPNRRAACDGVDAQMARAKENHFILFGDGGSARDVWSCKITRGFLKIALCFIHEPRSSG